MAKWALTVGCHVKIFYLDPKLNWLRTRKPNQKPKIKFRNKLILGYAQN